ncbi:MULTISPECIES: DUF4175 family protein [unclassified Mucilaginibacter]|uniref:DUF4175 family protein n=1 Tax=unclassified Mucilaginibacter TaxID=2617802 RepID=UPI002AC93725|nr:MULTISPECIES: DUF4175 family protein [unclassified Mucilaginibacter]MEB0261669.1 hypothetical protein [Mucilaginibacter sp. 10I4]MEB0278319.1 hypothetical protein [Mucilaginibacter sp. 10B2]MEB0301182.1 hypothetical protein [Mucilaginibacter sp. 5C4]WPX23965.1 DUF4175 family protein [Mucilaginibacter sp. 5C4]
MTQAENYDLLIEKINTFIRKYHFNNLLRGLIFLGAGIFSAYVVITLLEYFGNFNTTLRTILFYFFILLNVGLIIWLVLPPLFARLKLGKTLTHVQAAEIIGQHFNDVHDKLLNTLQLKKQSTENAEHRELLEASINQKIETLKPVSFPSAVNIRENSKYLKWVIPPAAVICIIAFAAPSVLTESTKRLIRHNEYFAPVAPFQFVLFNKNLSAVQGEDYKLDLKLTGDKLPNDIYVETANNTFKLDKENISRFHYLFTNLQQNTSFKLVGNGFSSAPYEIRVNLKPVLLHFDADLTYPAYLHKKNETIANAGDLTLPAGTVVTWKFHTQNASTLLFKIDGANKPIAPTSGNLFEHRERILKNTAYNVSPLNNNVQRNDSATYRVNVIADEAPAIEVHEKPDSVSMKAFYFNGRIQDDHGFSSLIFHYKIGEKGGERSINKPVKSDLSATQSDFFYFWDLKELGIRPGDNVTYYFEVADNDGVAGPKKARTPERTLNVPDAGQLAEELNKGSNAVKEKMQSAVKLAAQIEKSAQKLNQALLDKNALSFDEKKQVEELLQKRKDLDELVKDTQADNKKNLYNRQENQQQTQELMEMQKQIENLFNNVLDDKTKEMLQRLQQMLQESQKDSTRDELSKMQMDNKSLKKELDRILELYKKLDFEQKLNQNVNQLNQLAQDQQKLSDQTQKAGNNNKDLQQQEKLNNQFNNIKKKLDELQKENEKNGNKQEFKNPEAEKQLIDEQMNKSSDALKKNSRPQASKAQQQAAKQMKQLADKLKNDESEGQESENAVDARQLRELLKSLVNSSFTQEKIMQQLRNTSPNDPAYIALAQKQKDVKDNLKTAEDSLYSLSRRIPQIQSTVNKEIAGINEQIDQSLDNLGERKTPEAMRNQQFAMTSMNNLALMLSEALDQLQKQQSKSGRGKGKQPSLSQLSKMQQQLNQNMQKAREQMQKMDNPQTGKTGQQGQQGMSEQFAKMAREQQMIRQTLQQINKENNKDGTNGLGNLDKISKEMEQTENDLVNKKITNEALKRQEQIKTRLLEAEKAEQEREQDQKRESRAASNMPPGYIKALQNYEQVKTKQTEQIRTVPAALNLYYRQKIKKYFDQLNGK